MPLTWKPKCDNTWEILTLVFSVVQQNITSNIRQGFIMNKTYRIQCTIDVGDEYSEMTAVQTLTSFIMGDGDNWCIDNVQVINVEEITEKEE